MIHLTRLHFMEDWEAAELNKVKIIIWDHNRPLVCDDEHFAAPENICPSKPPRLQPRRRHVLTSNLPQFQNLSATHLKKEAYNNIYIYIMTWSVRMLDCMALLSSKARASCCGLCWWECSQVPNPKMTVIPKSIWNLWQSHDKIW